VSSLSAFSFLATTTTTASNCQRLFYAVEFSVLNAMALVIQTVAAFRVDLDGQIFVNQTLAMFAMVI
jgi:hypothetical protein